MSRPPVRPAPRRAVDGRGRAADVPPPRIPAGSRSPGRPAPSTTPTAGAGTSRGAQALRSAGARARQSVLGTGGAPQWVSGVLAGLQGALLSLLVVAVPALAAYVATSADPSNAEVGWPRAVGVGAVLWLMGHGAPLRAEGLSITLVPLGITALALFTAYASARRSAHPTVPAWGAATVGYVGLVVGVALLVRGDGLVTGTGPDLARLALGAAAVGGLGLGAGTVRLRRIRELSRPWWQRIHPLVRLGAGAGAMVVTVLVGVASVVTAGWVVAQRAAAGDVISGLGVDVFGGLVMAAAQLALAPNLVLWVVAWLAGPGFAVGSGTVFSPTEVVSGPLPALPMLSALPTAVAHPELLRWVPVVVVVAGALAGWWLHRRDPAARARHVLAACLWSALAAALLAGGTMLLASGAGGPGRLAVVGAAPVSVGAQVGALAGLGLLLVAVPASAAVRAAVVVRCRGLWARVRGRDDGAVENLGHP